MAEGGAGPPAEGDELEGEGGGGAADFVAVYRRHYPRLVRALELAGSRREQAEDIAQEAFARTLARWWRVRRGTNPPGYAYRVAFRLAKRRLGREVLLGDFEPAGLTQLGDTAGDATTRASVELALAGMPARRRTCAVACLLAGMPTGEAALALGIAPGTVRKQLERARADLRAALAVVDGDGAVDGNGAGAGAGRPVG